MDNNFVIKKVDLSNAIATLKSDSDHTFWCSHKVLSEEKEML